MEREPQVSFFKNCLTADEPHDKSFFWTLDCIKNGKWKNFAEKAKTFSNADDYKNFKRKEPPCFTVHGTFSHRDNNSLKEPNGLACMDMDHMEDVAANKEKLKSDPYVHAMFTSISGTGLCVFCKISDCNLFTELHTALRAYFLEQYGLACDENAKDISRLRIISHDPDLYKNENSMIWKDPPRYKFKNGKKRQLLEKNNHRGQILPHVAAQMAAGKSDEEIIKDLESVHIAPESVCSDPDHIDKLISDLRQRYFADSEKTGTSIVQYSGFWTNNFKNTDYQLSLGLLAEALSVLGYRLLDDEYVRVNGGVIYKITKQELYSFIIDLVSYKDVTFKAKDITFTVDQTTLQTKAQKEIRGNVSMLAIKSFNYKILRDSRDEVFFHFKNYSLVVVKQRIEFFTRETKTGVIWEDQIIPHEIADDDFIMSAFSKFLENVAGENINSFRSAIGYGLRNYNGSDGMKALWLCDESFEVGKNYGRTGKSLISKALGKVRKIDDCSGKDFNADNQFKFQNIDRSTQVYVIDDVKTKFDFRSLYNFCTEGVEFSRKHRNRVKLPLGETPQLVITSNYPPEIEQGSSTTGRLYILPLKPFYLLYAEDGGVKFWHGHVFFDEWNAEEWNRFYWYLARCVQYFFQYGLLPCNMTTIRSNRLRAVCAAKLKNNELANDFVDWIYNYTIPKSFSLEELITAFGEVDKQAFAGCLKTYFDLEAISFSKKRERVDGKQITLWRI